MNSLSVRKLVAFAVCCMPGLVDCTIRFREQFIPEVPVQQLKTGELCISNWLLVGPFIFRDNAPIDSQVSTDYLQRFGASESDLKPSTLRRICHDNKGLCSSTSTADRYVHLARQYGSRASAVAYAVTILRSSVDQEVVLFAGSDDGLSLWVNGLRLVHTSPLIERGLSKYEHVVRVQLRKGDNFLYAKIDQKRLDWAFSLYCAQLAWGLAKAAEFERLSLLTRYTVASGESVGLDLRILKGLASDCRVQVGRADAIELDADIPWREVVNLSSDRLQMGVHWANVRCGAVKVTDHFLVGTVEEQKRRFSEYCLDMPRRALQCQSLRERLALLMKPEHWRSDEPGWWKKVIFALAKMDEEVSNEGRDIAGLQLRGYRSEVDGQHQDYLLFIPKGIKTEITLVVWIPGTIATPRPFLESVLIADQAELDRKAEIAQRLGVAFAIVQARGNSKGAPILANDLDEVVRDIRLHFPIKDTRTFLAGDCEGARLALLLASQEPEKWAGVTVYGASLTGNPEGQSEPGFTNEFGDGRLQELTSNFAGKAVRVFVGSEDEVDPRDDSEEFVSAFRSGGADSTLTIIDGSGHNFQADDHFRIMMESILANIQSNRRPVTTFSTYNSAFNIGQGVAITAIEHLHKEAKLTVSFSHSCLRVESENIKECVLFPSGRWESVHCVEYMKGGNPIRTALKGVTHIRLRGGPDPITTPSTFETVSNLLASGFVCVKPRNGSSSIAAAERFGRLWRKYYFVDCRTVSDNSFERGIASKYNLVVFGSPEDYGGRIRLIMRRLGLDVSSEGIKASGTWLERAKPAIAIVALRHPYDRSRGVLWVTGNFSDWTVPEINSEVFGNYQFGVWSKDWKMTSNGWLDDPASLGVERSAERARKPDTGPGASLKFFTTQIRR